MHRRIEAQRVTAKVFAAFKDNISSEMTVAELLQVAHLHLTSRGNEFMQATSELYMASDVWHAQFLTLSIARADS